MKFKPNKHFIPAITYDIFNWSFNFTAIYFGWTVSPKLTIALTGLFVLRFLADWAYRKSLWNEQAAFQIQAKQAMMDFTARLKEEDQRREQRLSAEDNLIVEEIHDDVDLIDAPAIKKDILQ